MRLTYDMIIPAVFSTITSRSKDVKKSKVHDLNISMVYTYLIKSITMVCACKIYYSILKCDGFIGQQTLNLDNAKQWH